MWGDTYDLRLNEGCVGTVELSGFLLTNAIMGVKDLIKDVITFWFGLRSEMRHKKRVENSLWSGIRVIRGPGSEI